MSASVRLGLLTALGAYLCWGTMPLYFKLVDHIQVDVILAHRIIWAIPIAIALILIAGKWHTLIQSFSQKTTLWMLLSGVLIGVNWLVYIWAVNHGRILESSFGYYLNPLVNIAIGAIFFSERLRILQWVAVGFATLGVGMEAVALSGIPWVSLILCFSFALYTVIRKQVQIDTRVGFLIEVLILLPFIGIWMALMLPDGVNMLGDSSIDLLLLSFAGAITAIPLILFGVASKRLRLSTLGIMHYIGPSVQFCIALSFGEVFDLSHAMAFVLIWIGICIFSFDSLKTEKASSKLVKTLNMES